MNPTCLVYLKQYLDYKSNLDGKIRESHEYIRLINPCIKNNQQPYTYFSPPYIRMAEAKHGFMLFHKSVDAP